MTVSNTYKLNLLDNAICAIRTAKQTITVKDNMSKIFKTKDGVV